MFLYIVLDAFTSFKQSVDRRNKRLNFKYAKF